MGVPTSLLCVPYLRDWRLREALTQEDLAERAGVSRSTIVNAEKGAGVLPSTVQGLAKALRIKPYDLQHPPPV